MYDDLLEQNELGMKLILEQSKYQGANQKQTNSKMNDDIYAEIQEDQKLKDYKKKTAIDLIKMQSDFFFEEQKKQYSNR